MAVVEQIFPSLTWRIRHFAMYPDQPFEFIKLENDFDGTHFGLYNEHELTGVVSLFVDGNMGQFRKFAVLPQSQRQGFGKVLLQHLVDYCKIQKLTKIWCNARVDAKEFYAKFGFQTTTKTYTADGFEFVIMELELN